jgi:2-oxoglutarate ferredoxin oxidoreductase subunit gamma
MNLPSLDKFESTLQPGGVLIINSSLIDRDAKRNDITVHKIPANEIAAELGNPKVANMIILGALIAATNIVDFDSLIKAFTKIFAKKPKLFEINERAIHRGAEYIKKS